MKQRDLPNYLLDNSIINHIRNLPNYGFYKMQIDNNGFIMINGVNVYTPELNIILITADLPAFDLKIKKETKINGLEYFDIYLKAYNEGIKYFETEFSISPDTLYSTNAEKYVKDIHLNYFHNILTGSNKGWQRVKNTFPSIINQDAISEYGYYSGIVSKVDAMVNKHAKIFQSFDKCEHDLLSEQMKAEGLTNAQKALIAVYNNESVTRSSHGNDTYNHWLKVNNPNDRLSNPESKRKYKERIKLFEVTITKLPNHNKQRAIDDLNMIKTKFEKDYL